jgi:ABC-type branched-subunit amino acid transport system ATPase component/ABC-type branched-subunit amino acid transport system permease subunit
MIMLSGRQGTLTGIEGLGPLTLGKALTAAVLAGMRSFPRAMLAGIGVALVSSVVGFRFFEEPGLANFLMFLAVLIAVYVQSRADRSDEVVAFVPKVRPIPERLRAIWWVRHFPRLVLGSLVGALLLAVVLDGAVGVLGVAPSRYLVWSVIAAFAICAASVTVITGWAGQLSLAQMAFAGIGALTAAALQRGAQLDFGSGALDVTLPALPFFVSILVASVLTAALAALIGIGALRVRGLLLAVTTFMFALACQEFLFRQPVFSADFGPSVPFERGGLLGIDLEEQRAWFVVTLLALVLVVVMLGRLRRSGVGRNTIAVRDNPDAASAYTISVARTKLAAFALAGGIAGFGGSMLAGAVESVPWGQRLFLVGDSLRVVAMAVIGGLSSVVGPVIGALWVQGLPSLFPDNALLPLFASSIGLLFLLLYFPGGLVQLAFKARDAIFDALDRRLAARADVATAERAPTRTPMTLARGDQTDRLPETVLQARDLTVTFGGIHAVDHVDMTVRRHEIVGLIGTNGAGKSTFMNAVGGFVPSTGEVDLLGRSLNGKAAATRARLGLGRTFQGATLFPELTVLETVQVACEARRRTSLAATALCLPTASRVERRNRADAIELIDFLGLGSYTDHYISDLSTGTRRIVELAGLLALDAPMLCLDEPTAGLAQRETEAFGPLLVRIRAELGSSMLVIEHDMPLIMGMSDRVYCLEAGRIIAEGSPRAVRADSRVIASYLGTDERALARSGAAASAPRRVPSDDVSARRDRSSMLRPPIVQG